MHDSDRDVSGSPYYRMQPPGTHVVLSEFIDGDLRLHEVVVEDDDFPAEGSLFLFMVVGLQRER